MPRGASTNITYRRIHVEEQGAHLESMAVRLNGAGILPFFVTPSNELYFLLGKEQHVDNWRGSRRWSAFEGGARDAEGAEETALREFVEESLGVVEMDREVARQHLRRHALRVVFINTSTPLPTKHVTYVCQMPWVERMEENFHVAREYMLSLRELARTFRSLSSKFPRRYPFFVEGSQVDLSTETAAALNSEAEVEEVEEVLGAALQPPMHGCCLRVCYRTSRGRVRRHHYVSEEPEVTAYVEWFEVRRELCELLRSRPAAVPANHPALTVQWGGCGTSAGRVLQDVHVSDDCLEKMSVRLWNAKQMRAASETGMLDGEHPRVFFLPVIKTICTEFGLDLE